MKSGPDIKALKQIENRLLKTEAELAALPLETKAWVEDYLRRRYGWFLRDKFLSDPVEPLSKSK